MTFDNNETGDDVEFVDAENYVPQQKGATTYEQIVLDQISRCVVEGSKEMTGGYFKEAMTRHGVKEQYIPDQRQVYLQCIQSLHDLLLSFFDEQMVKFMESFDEQLDEIKQDKIDKLKNKINFIDDQRLKFNLMLQVNSGYLDSDSAEAKQLIDEKLDSYRVLFQQLMLLFSRKRYLIAQAIEE